MSSNDESRQDNSTWKKKYYSALDKQENSEKEWNKLESQLQNALTRISRVMGGLSQDLDRQLEQLRQQVQNRQYDKLRPMISRIVRTVDAVEEGFNSGMDERVLLGQLLEGVRLPASLNFPKDELKQRLQQSSGKSQYIRWTEDFSQLLTQALAGEQTGDRSEDQHHGVQQATNEGVFKRWFGGGRSNLKADAVATTDEARQEVFRQLLTPLVAQLEFPSSLQNVLEDLNQKLAKVTEYKALQKIARDLVQVINNALRQTAGSGNSEIPLNEALLEILQHIPQVNQSSEQFVQLQGQLEHRVTPEAWPNLLETVAELIIGFGSHAQQEKLDLERFLGELSTRLEGIDQFLLGMKQHSQQANDNGNQLSDAMQADLKGLRESVEQASELEHLKSQVQQRLEAIDGHLNEFFRKEEEREKAAHQQIDDMSKKLQGLEVQTQELQTRISQERELAMMDSLTGIPNRLAYDDRIQQEYARWKRFSEPLSVVVIDIDRFKKINDSYGHQAGDRVLKTIAQRLNSLIRETDFLARYGGEEFVLLMPGADGTAAHGVAEKLRSEVQRAGFHYRGEQVAVTISAGVAEFQQSDRQEDVFERADKALYQAKRTGRNQCIFERL